MDLDYLRAHPQQLPTLRRHQRIRETPVGGGDICDAVRLTLDDGASLFVKSWAGGGQPPHHFFATEAAGLRWLAEPDAVPVPEVMAQTDALLALEWVPTGRPSAAVAERFGAQLAQLHRAGADAFGAEWPGYIGHLPQDNTPHPGPWSAWFAAYRLEPHLRTSVDHGALTNGDAALVERVTQVLAEGGVGAADEPPARIHGDLWPGNLLWGGDAAWLIDPAAHAGHRETDLATLALFGGAPHLEHILTGYEHQWPLAAGWRARVPLHQLHLMLVHTAHFGAGWRGAVVSTAERALAALTPGENANVTRR